MAGRLLRQSLCCVAPYTDSGTLKTSTTYFLYWVRFSVVVVVVVLLLLLLLLLLMMMVILMMFYTILSLKPIQCVSLNFLIP